MRSMIPKKIVLDILSLMWYANADLKFMKVVPFTIYIPDIFEEREGVSALVDHKCKANFKCI